MEECKTNLRREILFAKRFFQYPVVPAFPPGISATWGLTSGVQDQEDVRLIASKRARKKGVKEYRANRQAAFEPLVTS